MMLQCQAQKRQAGCVSPLACISKRQVITLSSEFPGDIQFMLFCIVASVPAGRKPSVQTSPSPQAHSRGLNIRRYMDLFQPGWQMALFSVPGRGTPPNFTKHEEYSDVTIKATTWINYFNRILCVHIFSRPPFMAGRGKTFPNSSVGHFILLRAEWKWWTHCSSCGINSSCKVKLSEVICNMDFSLQVIRICSVSTFSLSPAIH